MSAEDRAGLRPLLEGMDDDVDATAEQDQSDDAVDIPPGLKAGDSYGAMHEQAHV